MPPSLQDLISHYQHMSNFPPNLNRCPCCQSEQVTFKQHDSRTRELRYCVTFWVNTFLLTLFRWKCSVCNATFTVYPEFLLPYKRFITPSMLLLCRDYLSTGKATYRQTVRPGGSQFAYKNNNNQELSHVSLWNWFKGLSVFNQYAHKAVKLLFKAVPDNSIHREFIPINPHKYQSESRRHCLEKVEFILRVIRHLSKHRINVRIFPTILN